MTIGVDVLIRLADKITAPLRDAETTVAKAADRMQKRLQLSMHLSGAADAASRVAAGTTNLIAGFTNSIREVERAKGELATLGVQDLDAVVRKGYEMQAQLAGVTADAFVRASYDIKSGIASLTDQGVADMTASAMIVAKATKAQAEQMTSLFATSYGIFKKQMGDLTDAQFGEQFGAALAASVRQFKTDGSGMQQAIESAGAGAVNLGMKMTEQMTLLGMMQQQMQAGEAGTALRAFAANAARAHEEFGKMAVTAEHPVRVRILDENGQLRAMPEILTDLRQRYGETLDAFEAAEIQKAFGTEEAMKMINALYGQEAAVRANAAALGEAAAQGNAFTSSMARAADNNWDATATLMAQKFDVLKQKIGDRLLPVVERLIPVLDEFMTRAFSWIDANPELVTGIGLVVAAIAAAATVLSPLLLGLSALVSGWALTAFAATRFATAAFAVGRAISGAGAIVLWLGRIVLPIVGNAIMLVGRALIANPIGAIIMGIALAAYLIYRYWEPISGFFQRLCAKVASVFSAAVAWISNAITGISTFDWARLCSLDGLRAAWGSVGSFIGQAFGVIWDALKPLSWASLIRADDLAAAWSKATSFISDSAGAIWDKITSIDWSNIISMPDWSRWLDFSWAEVLPSWNWSDIIPDMPDLKSLFGDAGEALDQRLESRAKGMFGQWDRGVELVEQYRAGLMSLADVQAELEAKVAGEANDWIKSSDVSRAQEMLDLLHQIDGAGKPAPMAIDKPETLLAAAKAADKLLTQFPQISAAANETLLAVRAALEQMMAALREMDFTSEGARLAASIAAGLRSQMNAVKAAAEAIGTTIRNAMPGQARVSVSVGATAATPAQRVQARASGGRFSPGWLLTGERGPELEYRSDGGYIADNHALRGMLDMAARARQMVRDLGTAPTRAVSEGVSIPALASVANSGAIAARQPLTFAPQYSMPLTLNGASAQDAQSIVALVRRELMAAEERARIEARRIMHD